MSSPSTNCILVTGYPTDGPCDVLENYFKNVDKSGGGDICAEGIQPVPNEDQEWIVKFKNEKSVKGVLKKSVHMVDGGPAGFYVLNASAHVTGESHLFTEREEEISEDLERTKVKEKQDEKTEAPLDERYRQMENAHQPSYGMKGSPHNVQPMQQTSYQPPDPMAQSYDPYQRSPQHPGYMHSSPGMNVQQPYPYSHSTAPHVQQSPYRNHQPSGPELQQYTHLQTVVTIGGIPPNIPDNEVFYYFTNESARVGGKVINMVYDINTQLWMIEFSDKNVADRIKEHPNLCIRDHKLTVVEFLSKQNQSDIDAERSPMQQGASPPGPPVQTKSIDCNVFIKGIPSSLTEDILNMFFENEKQTGGGDIEEMHVENGSAKIVFKDPCVAERVRSRQTFVIGENTLSVFTPDDPPLSSGGGDSTTVQETEDDTNNIVWIKGFSQGMTKDILEMFFENEKKNAGGPLSGIEVDADKGVAKLIFESSQVAQRVRVINRFTLGQNILEVFTPEDTRHIVWLKGITKEVHEQFLEMYFENEKNSGGGTLKGIEVDNGVAKIIFESPEVAERVRSRQQHVLGKNTLKVFTPETDPISSKTEESMKEQDITDDTSNIVWIRGVTKETTEDILEMFFENEKSGGGPLRGIEMKAEKGVARLIFEHTQVAERVRDKVHFVFGQNSFQVFTPEVPSPSTKAEKDQTNTDENINIVWLKGVPEGMAKDVLEMYFENEKKTGGGTLIELEIDHEKETAKLIFESPAVAERVRNKNEFVIGHDTLEVFIPEDTRNIIWVKGVKKELHKDVLEMFFENEKKSGGGPLKGVEIDEKTEVAKIIFENPDVAKRVKERPKLEVNGHSLTIIECLEDKMKKNPCEIIVKGFGKGITEENIEMFFENKKRSGGGDLESCEYDPERGIAIMIFKNERDANEVREKGSLTLSGHKLSIIEAEDIKDVSTFQIDKKVVLICEIPSGTDKETIEMYFESKKRSGGGKIEKMDYDEEKQEVEITFKDPEVAQRVLAKDKLEINKKKVKALKQRPPPPPPKGIVVEGIRSSANEEDIELFFENQRKSGGGEIARITIDFDRGIAYIEYEEEGVAQEVVKKSPLTFQGSKLEIELNTQGHFPEKVERIQTFQTGPHAIRIFNISPKIKEDVLRLYFENPKVSGEDQLEDMYLDREHSICAITFHSADAVKKILQKPMLIVAGVRLEVAAIKTVPNQLKELDVPSEPRKIFVMDLTENITPDLLGLTLDKYSKSEVIKTMYGLEPDVALVEFETEPDFHGMAAHFSVKPVRGVILNLQRVPFTRTIQVHSTKNVSKDTLSMYFESPRRSGGGEVRKMRERENVVFITFQDYRVVENVLKNRPHKWDGGDLHVDIYYDNLGIIPAGHDTSKPGVKIPSECTYDMENKDALKYLNQAPSQMRKIEAQLRKIFAEIDWLSTKNGRMQILCNLTPDTKNARQIAQTWEREVKQCLNDLLDDIVTETIPTLQQAWQTVKEEIRKSVKLHPEECMLEPIEKKTIICLSGQSQSVRKYKADIEKICKFITDEMERKKQAVEEKMPMKPFQLKILQDLDYCTELEKQFKTMKIEIVLGEYIKIKGVPVDIVRAKNDILEKVQIIASQTVPMDEILLQMMETQKCEDIISAKMKEKQIFAAWQVNSGKNLLVAAVGQNELGDAIEIIQNVLVRTEQPINDRSRAVFQTESWKRLEHRLKQNHQGLINFTVDLQKRTVIIHGINDAVAAVKEELGSFMKANTVLDDFIPLYKGMSRLMKNTMTHEFKRISTDLKSFAVEITPMYSDDNYGILIKANTYGLQQARKRVLALKDGVVKGDHIIDKPGVSKFFSQQRGTDFLLSLENRNGVAIEMGEEEEPREMPRLGLDDNGQNVLATFSVDRNRSIKVVLGDMTTYQVDAIVNPAHSELHNMGGLARAIIDRGGREIQNECEKYKRSHGRLEEGHAMTTSPGSLPCKYVIHAVGPMWRGGHRGEQDLLYNAVSNSLEEAKRHRITSIAIPSISTGIFHYPLKEAVRTIVEAVKEFLEGRNSGDLTEVHFIDNNKKNTDAFVDTLQTIYGKQTAQTMRQKPMPMDTVDYTVPMETDDYDYEIIGEYEDFEPTNSPPLVPYGRDKSQAKTQQGLTVKINSGEIADENVDCIVNSASERLDLNQGAVSKTILQKGGKQIEDEAKRNAPNGIRYGETVTTSGGRLRCRNIIHSSCSHWENGRGEPILRQIVSSSLKEADSLRLRSIAFPAIGTGNLSFPKNLVAKFMFEEVIAFSQRNPRHLKEVLFSLYHGDRETIRAFESEMTQLKTPGVSNPKPPSRPQQQRKHVRQQGRFEGIKKTRYQASGEAFGVEINGVLLQVDKGDITEETTDVIVNSTDRNLDLNMGAVSQAIARKGGYQVIQECQRRGRTVDGMALTTAGNLPSKVILHIEAPKWEESWKEMIKKILKEVESKKFESVSLPALGTGTRNENPELMAEATFEAIEKFCTKTPKYLKLVRVCIFQMQMVETYQAVLKKMYQKKGFLETAFSALKDISSGWGFGRSEKEEKKILLSAPVEFHIYANSQADINKIKNKLDETANQEISKRVLMDSYAREHIEKMDHSQKNAVRNLQSNFDVNIIIRHGEITIEGNHVDVGTVYDKIQKIFRSMDEQEKENFELTMTAKTVQWEYMDGREIYHDYPIHINSHIEKAYQSNKRGSVIWRESNGDTIMFDFNKMEAINDRDRRSPFPISRRDLTKNYDTEFPESWGPVSVDDDLKMVTLNPSDSDYQQIEAKFRNDYKSSSTQINNIASIKCIQYPFLYKQYGVKKTSIRKTCATRVKVDRSLWHETTSDKLMEINRHGFDRSKCGKTGNYGKGVYFLKNAYDETAPVASGNRYVYSALVITGEFEKGDSSMIVPPPKDAADLTIKYHSTVDDTRKPEVFVIFSDNQAYPEYLIEYN